MKILHVSHTDISTDSRILKEMAALRSLGWQVVGLGVSMDEGAQKSSSVPDLDIWSYRLWMKRINFGWTLLNHCSRFLELSVRLFLRSIRFRPQIIHCHDMFVLPLAVVVKILTGARLIYDAHELESDRNGLSKSHQKLVFLIEKISWKFIDRLITVSDAIDRWYLDNLGRKKSIVILNSPVEFRCSNPRVKTHVRKIFGIPRTLPVFISVGQLSNGRGIDITLEVFSSIEDEAAVVFMGFGEKVEKIREYSRRFSNIFFYPAVPHDEVVSICRSCDCGILLIENVSLSDFLCLPNKLFEYCFAEIPVIGSNFPEISRVINQYQIGLTTEVSVESMKDTVRRMIADRYKFHVSRDSLIDLCWGTQENNLLAMYRELESDTKKD